MILYDMIRYDIRESYEKNIQENIFLYLPVFCSNTGEKETVQIRCKKNPCSQWFYAVSNEYTPKLIVKSVDRYLSKNTLSKFSKTEPSNSKQNIRYFQFLS